MKLTPWFPPSVLPARNGVYEVSVAPPDSKEFDPAYSRFNGKRWNAYLWFKSCGGNPHLAEKAHFQRRGAGVPEGMYWRGLEYDPHNPN